MDLTHHFLLSMPGLANSWFDNTLNYIFEHDDNGALGFVINRPGPMNAGDLYDQLKLDCVSQAARSKPVFEGGPMETERGFVLYASTGSTPAAASHSSYGNQGIGLSGSTELLAHIGAGQAPDNYLLLLGYAGWGAGQLEAEVARNAWLTCEARQDVLFNPEPDEKLAMAANSLGIELSMLSADKGHA